MPSYRVFAADIGKDRDVLLAIWRRNLKDSYRLEEKIRWHFADNPCGEGRCWILEADGEPVGATSLGMRSMKLGSETISAGVACDLAVDRNHRFLHPALLLQKALLASLKPPVRMVYGFPGPEGASVLRRAGYRPSFLVDRYAKVLRLSPYLDRNARWRPFVRVAGRALDSAYGAFSGLHMHSRRRYAAETLGDFDERFDELWNRGSRRQAVLTVRDSRFLRWRYRDCPLREYTTIALLSPDRSRLFGNLIYYIENHTAICADIFAADQGGEAVDPLSCLLSHWMRTARGKNLTGLSLACSADDALLEAIRRLHFGRRTAAGRTAVPKRAAPKSALSKQAGKEQSRPLLAYCETAFPTPGAAAGWYFTPGDQPYN